MNLNMQGRRRGHVGDDMTREPARREREREKGRTCVIRVGVMLLVWFLGPVSLVTLDFSSSPVVLARVSFGWK